MCDPEKTDAVTDSSDHSVPTEQVRQGKGDQERLCHRPSAQECRDGDIAHETQNPAEQGPDANRKQASHQADWFHGCLMRRGACKSKQMPVQF